MLTPQLAVIFFSIVAIVFGYMCVSGYKTGRLQSKGCIIRRDVTPTPFRLTFVAYLVASVGSGILTIWFAWMWILH